jgi:GNAT superfamily N-acetyltransferase
VDIREIDRYDEAQTRTWWEVADRAEAVDRPWYAFPNWPAARESLVTENESMERLPLAAYDGEQLTGAAEVVLPLLDNTHHGYVSVWVDPARWRQGIGTALLAEAERLAAARARTTVVVEAPTPVHGPPSPAAAFLTRHGFSVAISDEHRVLDLPATEGRWPALATESAARHAGYRLLTWFDAVPPEHLEGYCRLQEAFNELAPSGDLELEPEKWDAARVHAKEERFKRIGRHETMTVALAPDGTLAALTELMISEHSPERALQGGTLVLDGHRGHRLGLAVKVANQQAVRARFPQCRLVHTWNADVNAQMNAINARLGFETVELLHEMQRAVRR